MTDALDLIAEARARQEKAERECQYWKDKAEIERRRCKRVIDAAKLRPASAPARPGAMARAPLTRSVPDRPDHL